VEQSPPLQPRQREYRLGLDMSKGPPQWQKLWHYNEACAGYPTRNFRICTERPSDDILCSRCGSIA
jgi:hypothetical protein